MSALRRAWEGWLPPVLAGAVAMALYALTLAGIHLGDATTYMRDGLDGRWFQNIQHLLPRALGGLAYRGLAALWPEISPFTAMTTVCIAAGGLLVGAFVQIVRELTGRTGLALAAGAGLALTCTTWRHASSYEIHVQPVAVCVLAVLLLARSRRATRPWGWLVAAGALLGLGIALHILMVPVAVACGLALLLRPGSALRRIGVAAVTALAALGTLQGIYTPIASAGDGPRHAFVVQELWTSTARFSEAIVWRDQLVLAAKLDEQLNGARFAFHAAAHPWATPLLDLLLLALLALTVAGAVRLPALWRRHGEMAVLPLLWVALQAPPIWRVEPGNHEYYIGMAAMGALWLALLADDALRRAPRLHRPIAGAAAVAVVLLAWGNGFQMALYRHSPIGTPVGITPARGSDHAYTLHDGLEDIAYEGRIPYREFMPRTRFVFRDPTAPLVGAPPPADPPSPPGAAPEGDPASPAGGPGAAPAAPPEAEDLPHPAKPSPEEIAPRPREPRVTPRPRSILDR